MKMLATIVIVASLGLTALPAVADDVADFYRNKTITIITAAGAGGGYGVYASMLGDHLGKYVPGKPNVIVSFKPGGGGLVAANAVYNVAPKDGTTILAPLQTMPTLQVIGKSGVLYDAAKFQWIGRAAEATSGFVVRAAVAANFQALHARQQETIVGVTQIGAPNHVLPALLEYCSGVKFKLVSGYKGSPPMALAYSRKEVDGLALPLSSLRVVYPEILKDTMIAQSGLARASDFPNVPLTTELCKDPEKRKVVEFFQTQELMGRSYAMPPGAPAARVAAVRTAFDAVMKDPAFLATAKKRQLEVEPMAGADLQKLVENHVSTDTSLVAAAKRAVGMK